MRSLTPAMAAAAVFATLTTSTPALAQAQPFVGQLMLTATSFCPRGWLPTEGQLLPINQNQVLFSLLGNTYGGDGKQTFALPKLAAPQPSNLPPGTGPRWCIALSGVYPSRS